MKRLSGYYFLILFFMLITSTLNAQAPFNRGVNITSWFQAGSAGEIQFTKYTRKDIETLKVLDVM